MRFGIRPSFLGSSFPDSSCPRTVLDSQGSVLGHLLLSSLALFQKSCPASHHQLSHYEDPVGNCDRSWAPVLWLQLPAGHFISDVWQLVIFRIEISNLVPKCLPLQTSCVRYSIGKLTVLGYLHSCLIPCPHHCTPRSDWPQTAIDSFTSMRLECLLSSLISLAF